MKEGAIVGKKTSIAWTDHSFNFWWGCTKVSPGCDGCYAEAWAKRTGYDIFGSGRERRYFSEKHWNEPLVWDKQASEAGVKRKVFCNSMADFFDNEVDQAVRDRAWEIIRKTRNLIWIILTKRIGNVAKMLPDDWESDYKNAYRHVWLVASIVNQKEAERDIPKLLTVPGNRLHVRGVSYEPALEPVSFSRFLHIGRCKSELPEAPHYRCGMPEGHGGAYHSALIPTGAPWVGLGHGLNWIIVGGESNQGKHRARPFDIQWARDTIRQCKMAGVPVFVKQLGSNPVSRPIIQVGWDDPRREKRLLKDGSGANLSEWPEDLCVREFPNG